MRIKLQSILNMCRSELSIRKACALCGSVQAERQRADDLHATGRLTWPEVHPFLVIKTKASKIPATAEQNRQFRHEFGKTLWKEIKALQEEHGVQIYGNSTGWWTGAFNPVVDYHFKYRHNPTRPVLPL
ncbi:hypothetical protein GQ600_27761 [Phytophthora cactorum]|nr:hypothetical protein GQ600_27761 [Phytophthora cactorum]